MDRRNSLLDGLPLGAEPSTALAAEIGPLASPLLAKDSFGERGAVFYVDYADAASLQAKYASDPAVDETRIGVDAIWGRDTLREAIDRSPLAAQRGLRGQPLDFVVASHVVEHVPDLVTWLREIASVLKVGGRLRLAVPDKRYCFDLLRRTTTLAEVCDAYVHRCRMPSPGRVLDFALNEVTVNQQQARAGELTGADLKHVHTVAGALAVARDVEERHTYHDVHCWVFTPSSFLQLFIELAAAGLVPFACERLLPTAPGELEFFVWLERCDDPRQAAATWRAQVPLVLQAAAAEPGPRDADERVIGERLRAEQLQHRIDGLLNSRSWRATAPLRRVASWWRQQRTPRQR